MNKSLDDMTLKELQKLAKDLKLTGYSNLNKAELVAFIKDTYRRARSMVAQAPMSTTTRIGNYVKQNGHAKLTARQAKQVERMNRRNAHRVQKVDIPAKLKGV